MNCISDTPSVGLLAKGWPCKLAKMASVFDAHFKRFDGASRGGLFSSF